jgi:hypothetical protein
LTRNAFPMAAALFFGGYLAVQIALPLLCLTAGSACNFGWTMYSGRSERWDFFVQWRSGEESPVPTGPESVAGLSVLGSKLDQPRFLPPYLCRAFSGAVAIRAWNRKTGVWKTHSCQP